jgi:hypothetical protein
MTAPIRSLAILASLFAAALMPLASSAGNPNPGFPGPDRLTWDIQLSGIALDDLPPVDVVEIDGFDATSDDVATLQAAGITVICYINAGAWEDWRADAAAYPDDIIGASYPGWEGERFVDIRRLDLLGPILAARLDLCAEKGFDAVDPDNVDTYLAETGFPLTEADQLAFNRWLANEAHTRDLAIGQKNVPELAPALVDDFDFAVTEDCLVDGWCDELHPYADAGKPVLMIEYTDRDLDLDDLCTLATGTFGAVVIKHRDLGAWSAHC